MLIGFIYVMRRKIHGNIFRDPESHSAASNSRQFFGPIDQGRHFRFMECEQNRSDACGMVKNGYLKNLHLFAPARAMSRRVH
jgi:hypothetical protein